MNNRLILLICFLSIVFKTIGQTRNSKVAQVIAKLQKAGIDTIITYNKHCSGAMPIPIIDTASCYATDYEITNVIWVKNNINYIQRFDRCYNYLPKVNVSTRLTNLIKKHYLIIYKEKIKPLTICKQINGKVITTSVIIDHSCFTNFKFFLSKRKFSKEIDSWDLNKIYDDDVINKTGDQINIPRLNINYHVNHKTYLRQLKDLAEKEISSLTFKRTIKV